MLGPLLWLGLGLLLGLTSLGLGLGLGLGPLFRLVRGAVATGVGGEASGVRSLRGVYVCEGGGRLA